MKPKLVEVTWLDTAADGGWRPPDRQLERASPIIARSVGFLLHQDKQRIVLVQSHAAETEHQNELVADALTIPAGMVTKVRPLRAG